MKRILTTVLLCALLAGNGWGATPWTDLRVSRQTVRDLSWLLVTLEEHQATVLAQRLANLSVSCGEKSLAVPVELAHAVVVHLSPPSPLDDDWRAAEWRDTLVRQVKAAPLCVESRQ